LVRFENILKIQKQIQYNRAHINFQPSHSRRGTEGDEELDDELVEELVVELDEERKAACNHLTLIRLINL
jgi:hypothetical protein